MSHQVTILLYDGTSDAKELSAFQFYAVPVADLGRNKRRYSHRPKVFGPTRGALVLSSGLSEKSRLV